MRRRAFTLIELLVVIGIILVLMSIIVVGFRHVQEQGAKRETLAELQIANDMLQEYRNINGLGNIENASPQTTNNSPSDPAAPKAIPVFSDAGAKYGAAQLQISDFVVNGASDMGDKGQSQDVARYQSNAVQRTQDVMYLLLRDPKNRALLSSVPPKRILEGQINSVQVRTPNDIARAVLLDGNANPIIFVPAGGIEVTILDQTLTSGGNNRKPWIVRTSGMYDESKPVPNVGPNDHPFFASAGQDGDFTKGEDNSYSFEK